MYMIWTLFRFTLLCLAAQGEGVGIDTSGRPGFESQLCYY